MSEVIVSGGFDDLRVGHVRFIEGAARLGPVRALLWSDAVVERLKGRPPKFPAAERRYLLESLRDVASVTLCSDLADPDTLPLREASTPAIWAVEAAADLPAKREFCRSHGLGYCIVATAAHEIDGLDESGAADEPDEAARPRVLVTGCFDWFHSGHVRFFEEVASLGDLYVVVGHDANIRLLKGEGHPHFSQSERRYLVQAVRFVKQALISSGSGWLDAAPEIERLRPQIYAVNEDGDKPEKRVYCQSHGIEYRVLRRVPKAGLPSRQSTALRGF